MTSSAPARMVVVLALMATAEIIAGLPLTTSGIPRRLGMSPIVAGRAKAGRGIVVASSLRRLGKDEDDVVVPEAVVRAVEKAEVTSHGPTRLTDADVSVIAGLPVDEARKGLLALADQTGGDLDVSESGDLVYTFDRGVRGALRRASARARRAELWRRVSPALASASRMAFGAALFASLTFVYVAITALSASSTNGNDDRSNRQSSQTVNINYGFSPFDVWYYSRPRYYVYDPDPRRPPRRDMNFLEACFSYVFGDADPDADLDDRRWQTVARVIRANGGAVTAEQLAPYLEPERLPAADGTADGGESANVDEAFVLPALVRFGGVPEVVTDADGRARIVYSFSDLMTTAGESRLDDDAEAGGFLAERPQKFSEAGPDQLVPVGLLGAANLVGVLYLGRVASVARAMAAAGAVSANTASLLALLRVIYPPLAAYALLFAFGPAVRYLALQRTNAGREERSSIRREWSNSLRSASRSLTRKLQAARARRPRGRTLGPGSAAFSTKRAMEDAARDSLRNFDDRLESSLRERDRNMAVRRAADLAEPLDVDTDTLPDDNADWPRHL